MLGELQNVQLPDYVLAGLYGNTLVAPVSSVNQPAPTHKVQWLGENKQQITILVESKKDVYLPDGELNFLTSIMGACKLNLGDVAIVNHHKYKISLEELQQATSCTTLLIFGISAETFQLGGTQDFTVTSHNNANILFAPQLQLMNNNTAEDKQLKTRLWQCLKQLFGV